MSTTRDLFVTRLYEAGLAEPGLMDELLEACISLSEDDTAGQAWCVEHAYKGYTSYASLDDLPARMPVFSDLQRLLDRHAAAFAKDLAFDLGPKGKLKLDSLWVNILEKGGAHSGHIHPHSVISGTLYVAVPKNAGALRLEDPRLPMMMAAPTRRDAPEPLKPFVTLQPTAGTVYLWESWLRHEVLPHGSKTPRVSISFNYAWI